MKKEYAFVLIGALFLLSYVLEAVVNPLPNILATPFDFLKPTILNQYPFTAAIISIRTAALFLTPLWLLSLFEGGHNIKGIALLILSGLLQLYSVQDIASKNNVVPLEWSVPFAFAGAILILPAILQLLFGLVKKTKEKFLPSKKNSPESTQLEASESS